MICLFGCPANYDDIGYKEIGKSAQKHLPSGGYWHH